MARGHEAEQPVALSLGGVVLLGRPRHCGGCLARSNDNDTPAVRHIRQEWRHADVGMGERHGLVVHHAKQSALLSRVDRGHVGFRSLMGRFRLSSCLGDASHGVKRPTVAHRVGFGANLVLITGQG